jgi:inhibitor of KinA sporulation pathway (predicted exonuclease)
MADFSHAKAIYIDLEAQCWDGRPPEGYTNEIIQIGIAEADLLNLKITRRSSYLVRPAKMLISPFCTELTGITEKALRNQGRPFAERFRSLVKDYGPAHKLCLTWGSDQEPVAAACAAAGIPNPLNFLNLAWVYRCYFGIKRDVGLENALKSLGLEFEGRPHDAMWDANNTARVHLALLRRMRSVGPIFIPEISDSGPQ